MVRREPRCANVLSHISNQRRKRTSRQTLQPAHQCEGSRQEAQSGDKRCQPGGGLKAEREDGAGGAEPCEEGAWPECFSVEPLVPQPR